MLADVLGCTPRTPAARVPLGAPSVVLTDMKRENDPAFTTKERALIAAARGYLEQQRHAVIDAYYSVEHSAGEYEVHAQYVAAYEGSHPLFAPGGHGYVILREDGSVIRYDPGD